MAIKVEAGDLGVLVGLQRLYGAISGNEMRAVFASIGRKLQSNVQARFDTKTDPSGTPWPDWAESTRNEREAEGRGTLLEYTGRMRASLTYQADADGVRIGFGAPYARHHELGEGVPKRAMLLDNGRLSKDDEADILRVVLRHLKSNELI